MMKKIVSLLVLVMLLTVAVAPSFAHDNVCTTSGIERIEGTYGKYAEGQGDYIVLAVAPGVFQLVYGTYHWVETEVGGGYYQFIWSASYECPETNGGSGVTVTEQGSWSVKNGQKYQYEHTEGVIGGIGGVATWETNDSLFQAFTETVHSFSFEVRTWGPQP